MLDNIFWHKEPTYALGSINMKHFVRNVGSRKHRNDGQAIRAK